MARREKQQQESGVMHSKGRRRQEERARLGYPASAAFRPVALDALLLPNTLPHPLCPTIVTVVYSALRCVIWIELSADSSYLLHVTAGGRLARVLIDFKVGHSHDWHNSAGCPLGAQLELWARGLSSSQYGPLYTLGGVPVASSQKNWIGGCAKHFMKQHRVHHWVGQQT